MRRFLVFLLAVGMAVSSAMLAPVPEAVAGSSSSGSITVDAQDPDTWLGAATAVEAVQLAVDGYEVVNLVGTFDFGEGSVFISSSVEILGAGTDAHGDYRTRILGGGYGWLIGAFTSDYDPSAQITIKDIEFDGAGTALWVTASGGVEVTGCMFRNIGTPGGGYGVRLDGWEPNPGVTGQVVIKGNHIDTSAAGDFSAGVFTQSIYADVKVVDNVVENFQWTGIWVNSAGDIKVKNNTINAGSTPSTSPYRNGILVGTWWLPPGDRGDIRVTGNTIITGGHIGDAGIATEDEFQEDRVVCKITDNEISFVDDATDGHGIVLVARFSNCRFKDNTVDGGGHELASGIALYPALDPFSPGGEQTGNTFRHNEIRNATVGLAGVYIDLSALTEDNRFRENELEDINGIGFVVDGDRNRFIENELEEIGGDGFHLFGDNNLLRDNEYEDLDGECVIDMGVGNRIRGEDCDD